MATERVINVDAIEVVVVKTPGRLQWLDADASVGRGPDTWEGAYYNTILMYEAPVVTQADIDRYVLPGVTAEQVAEIYVDTEAMRVYKHREQQLPETLGGVSELM